MIEVKSLTKVFRKPIRGRGVLGMLKTLFSRKYKEIRAVDDVSFDIGEGEIVGYIGSNGAGKSTTIKMVCKLPKPPAIRALCQAKRAPRAAFPSGCLAAQTKRWAEGIRVPAPLAGGGSTTARGILRLCPESACQTGLPWSSPPA